MRLTAGISIFLFIALFFAGCDSNQYQIVTSPDGTLYRFNKKTGELSTVMGDKKMVRLPETHKLPFLKREDNNSLEKPSDWKESRYPGKNLKVRLETVWRENKLCYRFSAYPYRSLEKVFEKKKQDYVYSLMKPGFNIELVDRNGFLIKDIKINLWGMTKSAAADNGEEELVMNSQIDCTKESYQSIGGYSVKWMIEPELIEDEKEAYIKSTSVKSENK